MPTDAQRRNLASAHHAEVQALKDKVAELEKQLENAFSAINYWKEEAGRGISMGWQPIETVSLDGTSVLGYWIGGKHDCAIHVTKFWNGRWWEPNEDYPQSEPTHWMPLPPPPTTQKEL